MIKARILTSEEWERLENKPPTEQSPKVLPKTEPHNVEMVVVEKDGEIVATLGCYRVSWYEGLWIAPQERGNPGILRPLLATAFEVPRQRMERFAFGAADQGASGDHMRKYLTKLPGSERMWVDMFVLHME